VWEFSAKAGHAKEENCQRLEGKLPPTASCNGWRCNHSTAANGWLNCRHIVDPANGWERCVRR